jgi:hypothetical protein
MLEWPIEDVMDYSLKNFSDKFGIPLVSAHGNVGNIEEFIEHTRGLIGLEGYIIRFPAGMLKVKADDYCLLHKTLELVKWEKDLLAMILRDKIDDALAIMPLDMQTAVNKYADDVQRSMLSVADKLRWVVIAARDNLRGSKKRFAVELVAQHPVPNERGLLFTIWDKGEDTAEEVVKNCVLNHLSTQPKLELVRNLIGGHRWADYNKTAAQLAEE